MSYEGREQHICTNGHYYESNEYPFGETPDCVCGAKSAWNNSIDDTNCDAMGYIPPAIMETFKIENEVVETCNLGHKHVTKMAVFKIPTGESLRHYWDDQKGAYVPVNLIRG